MSSHASVVNITDFLSWRKLQEISHLKTLKVLYTTMAGGPAVLPDIIKKNPSKYIPNSIGFNFQDQFSDTTSNLSNTMVCSEVFSEQASKLGLRNNDSIVIYDDFGNFCASRVWFMFKSMGHRNVYILEGGLPLYLESNLPTTNKLVLQANVDEKNKYTCEPDPAYTFVNKNYVLSNLTSKSATVADARSYPRFTGQIPETKVNLRAGHIPHSVNIHYASVQDDKGRFLSTPRLVDIFAPHIDKPLVFTCGSGVTACILAQAAILAGVNEVMVYDGSWSQWGADTTLPLATGEA